MKNLRTTLTGIGQHAGSKNSLWALLCLAMQLGFAGCTTIKREEGPTPEDPFNQPIGNLTLTSDSNGTVLLPITSLRLDQSKPFTFSFRNFQHGNFDLQGDSALIYVAPETKKWKADSGYVTVTQTGRNKEGFVKITNPFYQKPVDTNVVTPWVVVWLKGTPVPDMNPLYLDEGESRNLTFLRGMEEAGALIDSVWGFIHQAEIKNNGLRLTYSTSGGIGNFLPFRTDHVHYRIKRPNGLYFRGMLPVFIEDTAQPIAHNDVVPIQPAGTFIPWSTLMDNDKGSNPVEPRAPFSMRLKPLIYSGNKIDSARFGTIQDSTLNGVRGFFYKRMIAGMENDTTHIFLQEGPEGRISRSRLILTQ